MPNKKHRLSVKTIIANVVRDMGLDDVSFHYDSMIEWAAEAEVFIGSYETYERIECEVEKRANPTVTLPTKGNSTNQISVLSGAGSYPSTIGSHAVGNPTPLGFRFQATSYDSLETGGGLMLYVNGTVHIEFDAEI